MARRNGTRTVSFPDFAGSFLTITLKFQGVHKLLLIVRNGTRTIWFPDFAGLFLNFTLNFLNFAGLVVLVDLSCMFLCSIALLGGPKI